MSIPGGTLNVTKNSDNRPCRNRTPRHRRMQLPGPATQPATNHTRHFSYTYAAATRALTSR